MGNIISPCCQPYSNSIVNLILWEGTTRVLKGKKTLAGEIMFEFPERVICHADSFFIGRPIPYLSYEDELKHGQTYFVLPLDCFPCNTLTASSLAQIGSNPKRSPMNFRECPFEYIKGSDGRVSIKVSPVFLIKLITRDHKSDVHTTREQQNNKEMLVDSDGSFLCTTPELKKQYDLLVGSREQAWSPRLETISEDRIRFSPCRFIGLEWKEKERKL